MSPIADPPKLALQIGQERFTFTSLGDFDFAVSGRTGLPAEKLVSLVDLPDEALLQEAESIRKVERRFARILSGPVEDTTNVGAFLLGLDLSMISNDHRWRDIICALNRLDSSVDEFKKIALLKYVQYLISRQEVARAIYSRRQRDRQIRDQRGSARDRAGADAELKDTMRLDLTAFDTSDRAGDEFDRMPKGETVEIPVESERCINLLLVRHRYRIVAEENLQFVDEMGHSTVLRSGRNIVGRDATADVTLDAKRRDISRKHLIIDTDGSNVVKLTDISALGTFIPPRYMDKTGT